MKNPCKSMTIKEIQGLLSAQDRIRTSTFFRTLRPEHSASTNFATWAARSFKIQGGKYTKEMCNLQYYKKQIA